MILLGYNIYPKELQILTFLFKVRGAKTSQIMKELNLSPTVTARNNLYKNLKKLTNLKLIKNIKLADQEYNNEKMYYLSKDGFELVHYLRRTQPKHIGSGFGDDIGDFPYELYEPPLTQTKHFLEQVDFYQAVKDVNKKMRWKIKLVFKPREYYETHKTNIRAEKPTKVFKTQFFSVRAKKRLSNIRSYKKEEDLHALFKNTIRKNNGDFIHYRDNLHSSKKFGPNNQYEFKPDGEIYIKKRQYVVEIDMLTERYKGLLDKFKGYKRYFDYLTQNKKPLPSTILFITPAFSRKDFYLRRWHTISNAFFEALNEYASKINLVFKTKDEVRQYLYNEFKYPSNLASNFHLVQKVYESIEDKRKQEDSSSYFGTGIVKLKEHPLNYCLFSSPKLNAPIYCHIRLENCETLGWALLREIITKYEYDKSMKGGLGKFTQLIPIFYYTRRPPELLPEEFLEYKKFKVSFLVNIQKEEAYRTKWIPE